MNTVLLEISILAGSLALSFFLSGFEAGVFALNRLRIRNAVRQGSRSARQLAAYLENPETFLWTIFVGNTLANLTAICLIMAELRRWLGSWPWLFWVAFVAVAFAIYVLCDLLPKTLFRQFPNRLSMSLVTPFRLVHLVLAPLVSLIELFTRLLLRWSGGKALTGRLFANRDELRRLMQEAGAELTSTERKLINRVLDLQNVSVGKIGRSLERAVAVKANTPVREVLEIFRKRQVTRLPVWTGEGSQRRIAGVVNLKTLLYEEELLPGAIALDYLRPAIFLPESLRLEEALRRLQRSGQQFGIILDADRRERAIVTLWDILRTVLGVQRPDE